MENSKVVSLIEEIADNRHRAVKLVLPSGEIKRPFRLLYPLESNIGMESKSNVIFLNIYFLVVSWECDCIILEITMHDFYVIIILNEQWITLVHTSAITTIHM